MKLKLTLELDETLIERAEQVAKASGKTVTELVADYLAGLGQDTFDEKSLPPLTRALSGILEGADLDEADYHRHQARKHS